MQYKWLLAVFFYQPCSREIIRFVASIHSSVCSPEDTFVGCNVGIFHTSSWHRCVCPSVCQRFVPLLVCLSICLSTLCSRATGHGLVARLQLCTIVVVHSVGPVSPESQTLPSIFFPKSSPCICVFVVNRLSKYEN